MALEETILIERCKKYDSAAQHELYQLYRKKMFSVCMQYLNNYDDAKDMLQEGFIKIFTGINQYKGTGSFEGWMRRVIINIILMEFRKRKKLLVNSIEDIDVADEGDTSDEDNVLNSNLANLTEKEILSLLNELPNDQRVIFNLYCIEEHSHKEIAELLNIQESNSRIKLMRARKTLQKQIKTLTVTKLNI